jgi:peptide/nickel transport system permease protein
MLYSLPSFFVGTMLLYYFSAGGDYFRWFPTGGIISLNTHRMTTLQKLFDSLHHLILPLVCLSYVSLASISRYARAGLIDVLHADYIKTARAKGLSERVVICKHALRNGIIPIITILGSIFPMIVGGSVIIEVIFNIPGIGLEAYNAVLVRDYNAIMAIQLISAFLTLAGILISDILYAVVDPRITYD